MFKQRLVTIAVLAYATFATVVGLVLLVAKLHLDYLARAETRWREEASTECVQRIEAEAKRARKAYANRYVWECEEGGK